MHYQDLKQSGYAYRDIYGTSVIYRANAYLDIYANVTSVLKVPFAGPVTLFFYWRGFDHQSIQRLISYR